MAFARKKSASPSRSLSHEKRRAPRSLHDSVLEMHDGSGRLITGIGKLVDFSASGVCFSTSQVLKPGSRIHAELRLLKLGRLDITGRIIWVKRKPNRLLYGVEFLSVRSL